MTTSIFVRKGYFAAKESGTDLRDGDKFNPGGYFEARGLVESNAALFKRVGYDHHNTWKFDPITEEQAAAISDLEPVDTDVSLLKEFNDNSPWVWKDPRLCYTLGYWWQLVDQNTTCVLLLRRSDEEIFNSFQRIGLREGSEDDRVDVEQRSWSHINSAKRAIQDFNIPHCEIDYSKFREDPHQVIEQIRSTIGLSLTLEDLGFRAEFDHSSGRGSRELRLERISRKMPRWLVAAVKKYVPNRILKYFFPTHYQN
ncbi:MAG: hypothetical protein AAF351_10060 [Pseudomonadota bacterium]